MNTNGMTTKELIGRLQDLDPKGNARVRVTTEGQWAGVWDVDLEMMVETKGDVPTILLRT